jgi:hypothetical protein
MKKLLTICLFFLICFTSTYAQETNKNQDFKHEFALDVTDLIRQFLFSNNGFFPVAGESVTESYTLSYRLMYKDKLNLRLGVGGTFSNGEQDLDTLNFDIGRTAIRYRIGIDRIQPISKRWEAYYGLDFFQERSKQNSSYVSTRNNYVTKRETTGNRYGVSPLIGIRFRFNDRVGLQTSLNAEFYQNSSTNTNTAEVLNRNLAAVLPDNQTNNNNTSGLDINIPINLVLTFRL